MKQYLDLLDASDRFVSAKARSVAAMNAYERAKTELKHAREDELSARREQRRTEQVWAAMPREER